MSDVPGPGAPFIPYKTEVRRREAINDRRRLVRPGDNQRAPIAYSAV